jgi:rhodanese-related sulfurtransferase
MKGYKSILILLLVFVLGGIVAFGLARGANLLSLPSRKEAAMPKTFDQMVAEALAEVPAISAAEAHQIMQTDPSTLVIDVRDAADIPVTGMIPGAVNISLGTLTYKADHQVPPEWRDPNLQDFSRPIITTCETGEMAALAGKLLKDMGYTNVHILKGATVAWKQAGYPTTMP